MASIRKRTKASGDIVYDCTITIKRHGIIAHRESKTFKKQKLAKDWGMRREIELQTQDVYKQAEYLPIKDIIYQYLNDFPPAGRSKYSELNRLMTYDICNIDIHRLTTRDLIRHILERNKSVTPQTANNDLVWMKVAIQTMRSVMAFKFDLSIFDDARAVLKQEGKVARSHQRDRRPTGKELIDLSRYFYGHWLLHVFWFAIYSARRQSEITRLRWDDINHENKTVIIRNLKHPNIKNLNKRAKLPRSAYKLIMRQPKVSEFVFPYNSKTISTYFTNACHILGIKDLRFHDLRREATSRLFTAGLGIVEVQQITLHSSWSSLAIYTKITPESIDI